MGVSDNDLDELAVLTKVTVVLENVFISNRVGESNDIHEVSLDNSYTL